MEGLLGNTRDDRARLGSGCGRGRAPHPPRGAADDYLCFANGLRFVCSVSGSGRWHSPRGPGTGRDLAASPCDPGTSVSRRAVLPPRVWTTCGGGEERGEPVADPTEGEPPSATCGGIWSAGRLLERGSGQHREHEVGVTAADPAVPSDRRRQTRDSSPVRGTTEAFERRIGHLRE